ncbi:MAG: DNA-binding transcriptional ArsR family regulator [Planctomycetota bacterium]|jgi:ArsR family transcriptional regulator
MTADDLCLRMAALGNSTRLETYRVLVRAGRQGLPVAGVQERVGIPASTLSHHLRRLVEVGLVRQERTGTTLVCSADFAVMESTFALFAAECCADELPTHGVEKGSTDCC